MIINDAGLCHRNLFFFFVFFIPFFCPTSFYSECRVDSSKSPSRPLNCEPGFNTVQHIIPVQVHLPLIDEYYTTWCTEERR